MQLNVPDINIAAKLVQAILNNKAISIIYTSLSSGSKAREIVPHSENIKFKQAIELDYGMESGLLAITIRAALAGYLLIRLNIDCTEDATLKGGEFQL